MQAAYGAPKCGSSWVRKSRLRSRCAIVRAHPQGVAQVAESPQPGVGHQLGEVPTDRDVFPAAASQDRPGWSVGLPFGRGRRSFTTNGYER